MMTIQSILMSIILGISMMSSQALCSSKTDAQTAVTKTAENKENKVVLPTRALPALDDGSRIVIKSLRNNKYLQVVGTANSFGFYYIVKALNATINNNCYFFVEADESSLLGFQSKVAVNTQFPNGQELSAIPSGIWQTIIGSTIACYSNSYPDTNTTTPSATWTLIEGNGGVIYFKNPSMNKYLSVQANGNVVTSSNQTIAEQFAIELRPL